MITCETPGMMWTVEGKIENVPGAYGAVSVHVGIPDLSRLLAEHVGKWAKVRVELIEGPGYVVAKENPWPQIEVVEELKRMRSLAKAMREGVAALRATRGEAYPSLEEGCIETMADTMLVVCDQIEALDRRLRRLEGGK